MKKIILALLSISLFSCGNVTSPVTKTDKVDTPAVAKAWNDKQPKVEVSDTSKMYFYEYFEVLRKGEKGTFKTQTLLHKGDHVCIDTEDEEGTIESDVIVEVSSEAKEIKKI
jgi:hypothetical protein